MSLLHRMISWQIQTFGFIDRREGTLKHIEKELEEIKADPGDPEEWADLVFLAVQGLWNALKAKMPAARQTAIIAMAIGVINEKLEKNLARAWPANAAADPSAAVEHVRTPEELARKGNV